MKERNPFLLKADFGVLVSNITLGIVMLTKKKGKRKRMLIQECNHGLLIKKCELLSHFSWW